jgi:predicted Zn-dependent protease with MMP-like domain
MSEGEAAPGPEEFELLVEEALDKFPDEFLKLIVNLAVVVEDVASPQDAGRVGVANPMHLLGLYTGVPYTEWGRGQVARLPDVIKIYRLPILRECHSNEEVREKVRNVVLHELGHRAGLGEQRLRDLGIY